MNVTSSIHRRTPSLNVIDGRGLPIRQIAYLRTVAGESATALVTRQQHDVAGRLVAQWDPRLSRPNLTTVYGLGGAPLKVDSVDAGGRLSLPGLAGEALQRWDARGSHWRTTYDNQLRVVTVEENAQPDVETFTYADAAADAGHNLRSQLLEQVDPAGTLRLDSYGLLGQPLGETRTFHDAKAFVSSRTFSPLGTLLGQTDAGGHKQQSIYNVAGQLQQVKLQLKDQPAPQTVLEDAKYNAAGQIIEQKTGNRVISRWLYDPADGRLHRQIAQKGSEPALQDFQYQYDRVGNITAILNHAFPTVFFANQKVNGDRTFTYDSLYRLLTATGYADAPPLDNPGRPQPTDPNDQRNYIERYKYDGGGNLVETTHVREGASHTHEMFIDPASNRGVRWKPGDPPPDFTTRFDPDGNQLYLQPGQPMQWNSRGQLERVTLVDRNGSGPNDEEHYRYSQGERVHKRHETHTTKVSHFHDVRYLPGLEIRTKDNGEELHVITLDIGPGGARCLHWKQDPANIGADQLRYTLNDHLGSAVKEFDGQAQLISAEGYRPFGATAYLTARSAVEVSYRTVRYSGKEMDVSGLCYYAARYYVPWLGRWISADPSGAVDGLNLYAFVKNNPITYVDHQGGFRVPFAIFEQFKATLGKGDPSKNFDLQVFRHLELFDEISLGVRDTEQQILNHRSAEQHAKATARRTGFFLAEKGTSVAIGAAVGALIGTPAGPPGMVAAAAAGAIIGKGVSVATGYVGKKTAMNTSIRLESGRLNSDKVIGKIRSETSDRYLPDMLSKWLPTNATGRKNLATEGATMALKKVPYAGQGLSTVFKVKDIIEEVIAAGTNLTEDQISGLDKDITDMIAKVQQGTTYLLNKAKTHNLSGALGYTMERIKEKSEKRVKMLNDLRTVLHSKSRQFTAV